MLIRKANPGEGPVCDALLTRLIQTERQWEPNLDETFTVCDNYEHRMSEEGTLLLVAEENDEIVGFLFGFLYPSPVQKRPTALLDALFVCEPLITRLATNFVESFSSNTVPSRRVPL